jgi:hypothetical protein
MMSELTWQAELEAIPAQMAEQVAGLLGDTTLEGYKVFLDTMYHYTRQSETRLWAAAAAAQDEALRAFLEELAHDEAHHYKLALADLAAFGLKPSEQAPDSVVAFEAMWAALPPEGAAAYVGALVSLESVGDHIGPAAMAGLGRLGLGKPQARFVMVHLEADVEHGGLCRAHALRIGADAPDLLLQGARSAAQAWVAMHRCLGIYS